MLRQELLRESERYRTRHPGDFHDGHEARVHRGTNLVEGTRAGYHGHRGEIDCILDGCDLSFTRSCVLVPSFWKSQ